MDRVSKTEEELRRMAAQLIGAQGGKVAAENMTPEQRTARAQKAAAARWSKRSI